MQATVLGLTLGVGLLLVLSSFAPRKKVPIRPLAGVTRRIRRLVDEAGHHNMPLSALVIGTAVCAVTAFVLVFTLTTAVPVASCFAVFAGLLPWGMLRWQLIRRRKQLAAVWPDVVDHLRSAVRSGLSLPEGLIELAHSGPQPLREPFAEFGRDWRASVPMDSALERLKVRLADPVGDRIVLALRMTRELGGTDLGRLLDTLADVLRENARTRSELEARQSWTITGAKLAVAGPWAVVLLLSARPEAAEAYRTATGMVVLAAGLAVSVVCYQLMLRIGALPAEERVLV
ncbi:type II secretion system F family protein [Nesterenkonia muleiensis]|uniref:type II secretion system F family protein n=1 Tax=Nesterenkonia muleiensis TaxID=2282648 RepID=UPI000E72F9C7|nr:type II secretion system F family protein [Nesterenkonia muleiensis]